MFYCRKKEHIFANGLTLQERPSKSLAFIHLELAFVSDESKLEAFSPLSIESLCPYNGMVKEGAF